MKSTFVEVMVPLAQLYYRHVDVFFGNWMNKVDKIGADLT